MTEATLTTVFHEEVHSLVSPVLTSDGVVVSDVSVKHIITDTGKPETVLTPFGSDDTVLWCEHGHTSAQKIIVSWMTHGFLR